MSRAVVRPGAVEELGAVLGSRDRPVLLVVGGASWQAARARIEPALDGREVRVFAGFRVNPRADDVAEGVRRIEELEDPVIVAVGGGSVLDMAKLVALFREQRASVREVLEQGLALRPARCTLVAIPTTAGTGSEATPFATLYLDGVKHSVAHPSIQPGVALVDAELSSSMSPHLTACTGLDATCQAIESLWACRATAASRALAHRAAELAIAHLEVAVHQPSARSRAALAEAAWLAGQAIAVTRTTACHAMSYPLTIRWGVPHGHAVALTLGQMIAYNARSGQVQHPGGAAAVRDHVRTICGLIGAEDPALAPVVWSAWLHRLGLPATLSELGVTEAHHRQWIADGVNHERLGNNPRGMGPSDVRAVLDAIA